MSLDFLNEKDWWRKLDTREKIAFARAEDGADEARARTTGEYSDDDYNAELERGRREQQRTGMGDPAERERVNRLLG